MDELILVRLGGREDRFTLTSDAHAELVRYLDRTRAALAGDPDRGEVVGDLEAAVADRLEVLDAPMVNAEQMAAILADLGPAVPEGQAAPSQDDVRRGRFWCRIKDGAWFGGICLGVAAHSELRVDWVRTGVLLLTLLTGGALALVYLVLLVVLPVVPDIAEYERLRDMPASGRRGPAGEA